MAMDYRRLLASFQGRIGRGRYWLATLVILCSMLAALLLLTLICDTLGIASGPVAIDIIGISASIEPADGDKAVKAALFPDVATILMTLVFAWFFVAASIKRLHDRNRSGWWIIPFVFATGIYSQFGDRLGDSWPAALVGLAVLIGSIWGGVEMYGLKGTRGPNRFGPDPLEPVENPAHNASHWDQLSELEFVPHSASPSPPPHVKRGHD
jgi:uncharacterized membrane protein YhaH (DUF805 family)